MLRVTLAGWGRIPVILRAVISGVAIAAAGTLTWVLFVTSNQKVWLSVPWAIVPTALFLWLFWRYLGGEGWPRETAEARRVSLRANPLSPDAWGMSIFAGLLGLAALLPLLGVMSRMVRLPAESQPINTPDGMPFVTLLLLLVMGSIVAGVVEEAAFRGYLQGPIERRHGPVIAILIAGSLFGLAHFTHHPAAVLAMLPFYVAVSAAYGGLAWATNSILPGLVLHAGGDIFSLTRLWATGKPEWQIGATPPALIWESGTDAAFWGTLAALIILGGIATWAYLSLATLVRGEHASPRQTAVPSLR